MSQLPHGATQASQMRFDLAQALARQCPARLGREIFLTGSVSRGLADDDSDIELSFLVDTLPAPARRPRWLESRALGWLRESGAADIMLDSGVTPEGSAWATFSYRGIWVEASWQSIPARERLLRAIRDAQVLDHNLLRIAWIMQHALPLRTTGLLSTWQAQLVPYPEALQRKLIAAATEEWRAPHVVHGPSHWGIRPGEKLSFVTTLISDVHRILRLVFAINQRWEPDWKWLADHVRLLDRKPDRLVDRIGTLFATQDPITSRLECNRVILETLDLVPSTCDVAGPRRTIAESLSGRRPQNLVSSRHRSGGEPELDC
jgi:hypothetical protein